MKVLIVADGGSYSFQNFFSGLKKYNDDIEIHLYDKNPNNEFYNYSSLDKVYKNDRLKLFLSIPYFRRFFRPFKVKYDFKKIDEFYDIVHILAWTHDTDLFLKNKHQICKKLLISITGRDFTAYRKEPFDLIRSRLMKHVDAFVFAHANTENLFTEYYHIKKKTFINKFGVGMLDKIDVVKSKDIIEIKKKWGFPIDKPIIVVGSNGVHWQQHNEIMDELLKYRDSLLTKLFLVFPITYNRTEHLIAKLKKKVNENNLDHIFLENFLSEEKLADLRIISDVMIQVQTYDQFSGATQEHLHAGSVVITGSWLPYDDLKKAGAYYHTVNCIKDIPLTLQNVLENLTEEKQKCTLNHEVIANISGMKETSQEWFKTYKSVL